MFEIPHSCSKRWNVENSLKRKRKKFALRGAAWSLRQTGKYRNYCHSEVEHALKSTAELVFTKRPRGRKWSRKWKLTEVDVNQLQILSTRDRRKTSVDLQVEINASWSVWEGLHNYLHNLFRQLNKEDLKGRVAAGIKTLLGPVNIQKHLGFAKEHRW